MTYATKAQAIASLREFSPVIRRTHRIVRFYSEKHASYRYGRVLAGQPRR